MAWVTTAEAKARTGWDLSAADLALGQSVIEDALGIDETDSAAWLKARDLRHLARATIYQAKFLVDNPGVLSERDLVAVGQPDLRVTFKQPGAATLPAWMSPMAARVLRKLSFAGVRAHQVDSALTAGVDDEDDYATDNDWEPLP